MIYYCHRCHTSCDSVESVAKHNARCAVQIGAARSQSCICNQPGFIGPFPCRGCGRSLAPSVSPAEVASVPAAEDASGPEQALHALDELIAFAIEHGGTLKNHRKFGDLIHDAHATLNRLSRAPVAPPADAPDGERERCPFGCEGEWWDKMDAHDRVQWWLNLTRRWIDGGSAPESVPTAIFGAISEVNRRPVSAREGTPNCPKCEGAAMVENYNITFSNGSHPMMDCICGDGSLAGFRAASPETPATGDTK